MLDDLEKELVVLTELFDELKVRLGYILLNITNVEEPQTPPPPSPLRSVVCVRVEDLCKQVISLRRNMSETLSQVDLP